MAQITVINGALRVSAPYYPPFAEDARALGGRWDPTAKAWRFDPRDQARVEALVARHYGAPGDGLVTVTLAVTSQAPNPLYGFGRFLAKREFRDRPVQLGAGVITAGERFPRSAGSNNHPRLLNQDEEVLVEVKDVPASLASQPPRGCRVVAVAEQPTAEVPVAEQPAAGDVAIDINALLAEREQLLARLAEIEKLLAGRV